MAQNSTVQPDRAAVQSRETVASGYRFQATMQLRTPLRVLRHHGEIYEELPDDLIIRSQWEGIWMRRNRSFSELGIDLPDVDIGLMASSIGYIPSDGGVYIEFLIAVREIVETINPIEERIASLNELSKISNFAESISRSGGMSAVIAYFFPLFITTLKGLTELHRKKMIDLGLLTPRIILERGERQLLNFGGIGKAKLTGILKTCRDNQFPDDVYIDRVER